MSFNTSVPLTCHTTSRKAASTASALAERLEMETTHNLYGFWKFAFPGTEHINIKSPFFAADMELTIELLKSAST